MRGEGVTKPVNPATLGDLRPHLRLVESPLSGGLVHRTVRVAGIWKQQQLWPGDGPVTAKLDEQPLRQKCVAVLPALSLLDPNRHPVAVDIADLEPDHFAHAQSRSVRDHQQHTVLRIRSALEEPLDLLSAQDLGEPLRHPRCGNAELRLISAERDAMKESNCMSCLVAGAVGKLSLLEQVQQIALHLLLRNLSR